MSDSRTGNLCQPLTRAARSSAASSGCRQSLITTIRNGAASPLTVTPRPDLDHTLMDSGGIVAVGWDNFIRVSPTGSSIEPPSDRISININLDDQSNRRLSSMANPFSLINHAQLFPLSSDVGTPATVAMPISAPSALPTAYQ